jgi:hypothetical protein
MSANHEHGAAPPQAVTTRDAGALERVARFVATPPNR